MFKQLAQALGFSSLLLLLNYVDLTSSDGDIRFHWPRPMRSIAAANLLDILIVGIAFFLLLWVARRTRLWPYLRLLLAAVLPCLLLLRNEPLFPFEVPTWVVAVVCAAWLVGLLTLHFRWQRAYVAVTHLSGVVLAGFALFACLMSIQLVRSMLWHPGPQQTGSAQVESTDRTNKPRLVWVIYDELSYDQAFEHRDPSLVLPNFDRLRAISTTYSDVLPIANKTAQVIPSLLQGKRITDLSYSWSNQLSVQSEDDGTWNRYDPQQTIFALARETEQRTSIVGWYLPYCPLFKDVVDECYWTNADALDSEMVPDASLAQNTIAPLLLLAKHLLSPKRAESDVVAIEAKSHWATYKELQQRAVDTVKRDNSDFIYLHMPVPHPPGMYSRRRHQFSATGSYLGSLVLADTSLGELLDALQASPRWNLTTVIVMGDHSWRVGMWSSRPGWTARNQAISHGQFDPRPALLIHKAGQVAPLMVSEPFPQMQLHDQIVCRLRNAQQECF